MQKNVYRTEAKQNQAKLAQVMVVCSTYLDERDFFTQFDEKRVCSNSVLKTKNEKNEVSMSALECVKSTTILLLQLSKLALVLKIELTASISKGQLNSE